MGLKRITARVGLALIGLTLFTGVFAWLGLPSLIQWQAPKYLQSKTGHLLSLERPSINPLSMRFVLRDAALKRPDDETLLSFKTLDMNLSALALLTGKIEVESIQSDGLYGSFALLPEGRSSWQDLIDAFAADDSAPEPQQTPQSPPELLIALFQLNEGELFIEDRRVPEGFTARIQPVNLQLSNLSTRAEQAGQFTFQAKADSGEELTLQGQIDLAASSLTASLSASNVNFEHYAALLKDQMPYPMPEGLLDLGVNVTAHFPPEGTRFELTDGALKVSGFALRSGDSPGATLGSFDTLELAGLGYSSTDDAAALALLRLDGLSVRQAGERSGTEADSLPLALKRLELLNTTIQLSAKTVTAQSLNFDGLQAHIQRDAEGAINLQTLLTAYLPQSPASSETAISESDASASSNKAETPPSDWQFTLAQTQLGASRIQFQDASFEPQLDYAVNLENLQIGQLSQDLAKPVPMKALLEIEGGGTVSAAGQITPASAAADINLDVQSLAVAHAQPFITPAAKLDAASGLLAVKGKVTIKDGGGQFTGQAQLSDVLLNIAGTKSPFLRLASLDVQAIDATQDGLLIDQIKVKGLQTRLAIAKDKSTNLNEILVSSNKDEAPANKSEQEKSAKPYPVKVNTFNIAASQLDFEDRSLVLPFGARIRNLEGQVTGIDTASGKNGRIKFSGRVNQAGRATGSGTINFADPTDHLVMDVAFKDVEMKDLTPYSATFASRTIESGVLALNLNYDIQKQQLNSRNQIIIEKLKLGEKVDSPEAVDLPLDLAIALLQDPNGVIDIGLPIKGSLNDPGFGLGEVIVKTFSNLLTKIVTSPFKLLGSLAGAGADGAGGPGGAGGLQNIAFSEGTANLAANQNLQISQMAEALKQRPNLKLKIQPFWAEMDRDSLKSQIVKQKVFRQMGVKNDSPSDLPALDLKDAETQKALKSVYAAQRGGKALRSIESAYRKAHPKDLPDPSLGQSLMGLFDLELGGKPELPASVQKDLANKDFYQLLFDELKDDQPVSDELTAGLAESRAQSVMKQLLADGIDESRIQIEDVQHWEGPAVEHQPLKMELKV